MISCPTIWNKEESSLFLIVGKGGVYISFTQLTQQKLTAFHEVMNHFHRHNYRGVQKVLSVIPLNLAFSCSCHFFSPTPLNRLRPHVLLRSSSLCKCRCRGLCFLPSPVWMLMDLRQQTPFGV